MGVRRRQRNAQERESPQKAGDLQNNRVVGGDVKKGEFTVMLRVYLDERDCHLYHFQLPRYDPLGRDPVNQGVQQFDRSVWYCLGLSVLVLRPNEDETPDKVQRDRHFVRFAIRVLISFSMTLSPKSSPDKGVYCSRRAACRLRVSRVRLKKLPESG